MASTEHSVNAIAGLLPLYFADKQSTMIWGPPGVGKSDIIRQIAQNTVFRIPENPEVAAVSPRLAAVYGKEITGRQVYDIRLLLCQPTDLKGIPVFNPKTNRGAWVSTGLFPFSTEDLRSMETLLLIRYREKNAPDTTAQRRFELEQEISDLETSIEQALRDQHSLVFLDEISAAPKMVQATALQLVLDRSVGTYKLPDGVDIVAAGNRSSDKSGATAMSGPLSSRFSHLNAGAPSLDEWISNFAQPKGMPTEVIGFLKFRPAMLHQYDPSKLTGSADAPSTFPCPRTWAKLGSLINANNLIKSADDMTIMNVAESIVGMGAAAEFTAWLKIFNRLPDPAQILDGHMESIDFLKLSRDPNRADEPERDVKSRSLSLRFAFFYSLASNFVKRAEEYSAKEEAAKKSGEFGSAAWKKVDENFTASAIRFFRFINLDANDIEYGMVIVHSFLLKNVATMRLTAKFRTLQDPTAKGNLDRIIRVMESYRDVK